MLSTVKGIIRNIKLYELGIIDKLDGYDELMILRGLYSFRLDGSVIQYGKTIDDIKFTLHENSNGNDSIYIKEELWFSITVSFKLLYSETRELTMWSIGDDPNLEGVRTIIK